MSFADKFIKKYEQYIGTAIDYIRSISAHLSPKDDWVEGARRRFALLLDPYLAPLGRPLVAKKGQRDHFCTAQAPADEVEVALATRYQRNLTSTRKYRTVGGERQWADGSWVYDPMDTNWQHHVFIFDNGNGTTYLYGHKEYSAEHDPYGHVTDEQTPGDPNNRVSVLLDEHDITYENTI